MALGADNTICKREFVEAMRQRLVEKDPELGKNVDEVEVQKNLGALGTAVQQIATVYAETLSDATTDPAFWQWLGDLDAWLQSLSAWQTGLAAAFQAWAPVTPTEQALKASVLALAAPGPPPAGLPAELLGRIR